MLSWLWVQNHSKYFNFLSPETVFIRQNLTSEDVRFWRINTVPGLKGLFVGLFVFQYNWNVRLISLVHIIQLAWLDGTRTVAYCFISAVLILTDRINWSRLINYQKVEIGDDNSMTPEKGYYCVKGMAQIQSSTLYLRHPF